MPVVDVRELAVPSKPERMKVQFDDYQVNFAEWELRKGGVRVRLQRKPFQILRILVERPGELVTRAELAAQLWPDLHVDFERSLNTAVNCLRQALGDSSKSCRYVETCPGLGYRFIGALAGAATAVAGAAEPRRSSPRRAQSPAQADYVKGVLLYSKMTSESLARAGAYFETALKPDAGFAAPHAGLAHLQNLLACWSMGPTQAAAARAKVHAENALKLDASLAAAHSALGTAARLRKQPARDVEHRFRTALELDNSCLHSHIWYGDYLCAQGRFTEAIEQLQEAQLLDPVSLIGNFELAWVLYAARDFRSSLAQSWNTLMLEPGFAPAQYTLGLAHLQLGQIDEAITEFENARRCSDGHPATVASLSHALARAGRRQEAVRTLDELEGIAKERFVSSYWRALALAGLEDFDAANGWLGEAAAAEDALMDWVPLEPRFDALRTRMPQLA